MKRTIAYVFLVFCILLCSACSEIQEGSTTETTSVQSDTSSEVTSATEPEATTSAEEKNELTETESSDIASSAATEESSEATSATETDTSETTSCETSYSFEELFNPSAYIDLEKLSKVSYDYARYAASGPVMHNYMGSTDQDLLNSVIDYVKSARFTLIDSLTPDAGEYTATFYEGDRSFEFKFNTEYEFVVDGKVYVSSAKYPFGGKYSEDYYYIEAREELNLSSYGNVTELTDFDLTEIRLHPIYVEKIGPDLTKDADLIVDGKTFKIESADIIDCNQWGYFTVISDKDFSSLIPEGETESMLRFDYEYDNGSRCVFVSNNVIYTLDEIMSWVDKRATQILNGDGTACTDRVFTGNEVLTVKFAYNYGSTVSYAGSEDDLRIYKNALNSSCFPVDKYDNCIPIYRIDTLEDLEQFKATFGDKIDFDKGWEEVSSFNEVMSGYDEGFFSEYSLLLVYVHSGSVSLRYVDTLPQTGRSYIYVHVKQANSPEILQDLEASWFITVVFTDESLKECTHFDAHLARNN